MIPSDLPPNMTAKVDVTADGCWAWKGAKTPTGYGVVSIERRARKAHRYSYLHLVGPVPDGLVLDHLCRNRACVNPAHMEPVTQRTNVLRGNSPSAQKWRSRQEAAA